MRPDMPWQGGPPVTTSTSPGCGYLLSRRLRRTKAPTYTCAADSPEPSNLKPHGAALCNKSHDSNTTSVAVGNPGRCQARNHMCSLCKANQIQIGSENAHGNEHAYMHTHTHACVHMCGGIRIDARVHGCVSSRCTCMHTHARTGLFPRRAILRLRDESTQKCNIGRTRLWARWTF